MEWLGPTLKPYDLLPKSMGGTVEDRPSATKAAADATKTPPATAGESDWYVTFHDVLDVVNPLQHLPIVGTVYRALTHEQIKPPEKIIGDTLYGGLTGLASSVADLAFEKITGHNFGDTVLSFFTGHYSDDKPTAVASTDKPAPKTAAATSDNATTQTAAAATTPSALVTATTTQAASANETALAQSLTNSGMSSDMAQRALYAYRRSMGASDQAAASPF